MYCNHLVEEFMWKRRKEMLKKNCKTMKSTAKSNAKGVMDTSSPSVYPHVQNKQKKQFEIRSILL